MAAFSYTLGSDATGVYIIYTFTGLQYLWGSGSYLCGGVGHSAFVSGVQEWFYYRNSAGVVNDGKTAVYPSASEVSAAQTYTASSWCRIFASGYYYPYLAMWSGAGPMWGVTASGSVAQDVTHPGIYITAAVPRPGFFYWSDYGTAPLNSSAAYYVPKAAAFNALRLNIIKMLVYKGKIASEAAFDGSAYWFPLVTAGEYITAARYNSAAYCINQMHGASYVAAVTANSTPLTMNYFYNLQAYLNGIA